MTLKWIEDCHTLHAGWGCRHRVAKRDDLETVLVKELIEKTRLHQHTMQSGISTFPFSHRALTTPKTVAIIQLSGYGDSSLLGCFSYGSSCRISNTVKNVQSLSTPQKVSARSQTLAYCWQPKPYRSPPHQSLHKLSKKYGQLMQLKLVPSQV
ncbi:hypothetical protein RJ639_032497 [Escallonia herrerae]|uniref:Uncharacterized protein n=1 Tax=Escallonia herrerae TaxID=1293975 RepID=A0AA88X095_9ASTE|nr:hypothetical protein RJ639_032497 [Escallonia herrerae]